MENNTVVSCEIPNHWQVKLDDLGNARGKSTSQIVYEAIALYLGEDVSTLDNRLIAMEEEVSRLNTSLEQLGSTVQNLQQKLVTAASIIGVTGTNSLGTNKVVESAPNPDEEVWDDEPDEILYDFLEPGQTP